VNNFQTNSQQLTANSYLSKDRKKPTHKLNLSYFISRRISQGQAGVFSSTIHKIAIITIAVGLSASIISFLIMTGFQSTVKRKISDFSGDLIVRKYTLNNSKEEQPFSFNIDLYNHPEKFEFVDHVEEFSHKVGLIKTENEILGIILKGVGRSFDVNRFHKNMVSGQFIHFSDSGYAHEVVLSQVIADKINVKVGENIIVHFFQNPPRFRKLKVIGIYETNLSDYFDGKVIIGDIKLIQRLEDWNDSTAGGLQVYLKGSNNIDATVAELNESLDYNLSVEKISEEYSNVFEWLGLINRQVGILGWIILTVICVNMISVVLILVMERTQMIGVLKALGATNRLIRSVFVYSGISLILKGLLFGNIVGLGLCYIQYRFQLIKLNAHDYYMSYVPVSWNWEVVVVLNLLVFLVVTTVLLLPTAIVARVNPIRAIRFD
jgi:lipoprotein-releasing system permease protein